LIQSQIFGFNLKKLKISLLFGRESCKINPIETIGESFVSGGSWGEDSYRELADAVHSQRASSALKI
jgi:hypothetical protein